MILSFTAQPFSISEIDDPDSQPAIARKVTGACQKLGLFLIKEHSIPSGEIDEMFSLGKTFFSLSEESSVSSQYYKCPRRCLQMEYR